MVRIQASYELGEINGQGLVDYIQALKYGYMLSSLADEDIKDAIDAKNNYMEVFSNNEQDVQKYDFVSDIFKMYTDIIKATKVVI